MTQLVVQYIPQMERRVIKIKILVLAKQQYERGFFLLLRY